LELADAPGVINFGRRAVSSPAVVGVLLDVEFLADVGDREALGQVAVGVAQEALDLIGSPSLAHKSLLGPVRRGLS
jgi:hypothetical protein